MTCLWAGSFTFLVCMLAASRRHNRQSLKWVVLANALTGIFAVLTAVTISVLHLPSGH